MLDKIKSIINRFEKLQTQMLDPEIATNREESIKIHREISSLQDVYEYAKEYEKFAGELKEASDLMNTEYDADILEMAKEQKKLAESKLQELEEKIKIALLPKDPNDDKNIFLEIRPAAGGDEAGLFGAELLRMYLAFAQKKGRKPEIVEQQLSDIGGVKLVTVRISGNKVYSIMKFESGVHRVQRIPDTESQGRVHTSTVTVAIMPEVEDVNIKLDMSEIEMDTYAASSAGGQNANKNQTGVRLRHKPTGIIVDIGDSKSQMHNKERAFQILKAKLYQIEMDKQQQEQKDLRLNQIGSGDRSEKIRTYNFPQDRVTDHRIKESWSNIPQILMGELDDILQVLVIENQTKLLQVQGEDND